MTAFLVKLLAQRVQRDDYEPAAEIGKLLMENKCSEKYVPNLAGIAAFAVSDFDAAEKYLGVAEKEGYYQSPPKDDKLAQVGAVLPASRGRLQGGVGQGEGDPRRGSQGRRPAPRAAEDQQGRHRDRAVREPGPQHRGQLHLAW